MARSAEPDGPLLARSQRSRYRAMGNRRYATRARTAPRAPAQPCPRLRGNRYDGGKISDLLGRRRHEIRRNRELIVEAPRISASDLSFPCVRPYGRDGQERVLHTQMGADGSTVELSVSIDAMLIPRFGNTGSAGLIAQIALTHAMVDVLEPRPRATRPARYNSSTVLEAAGEHTKSGGTRLQPLAALPSAVSQSVSDPLLRPCGSWDAGRGRGCTHLHS